MARKKLASMMERPPLFDSYFYLKDKPISYAEWLEYRSKYRQTIGTLYNELHSLVRESLSSPENPIPNVDDLVNKVIEKYKNTEHWPSDVSMDAMKFALRATAKQYLKEILNLQKQDEPERAFWRGFGRGLLRWFGVDPYK